MKTQTRNIQKVANFDCKHTTYMVVMSWIWNTITITFLVASRYCDITRISFCSFISQDRRNGRITTLEWNFRLEMEPIQRKHLLLLLHLSSYFCCRRFRTIPENACQSRKLENHCFSDARGRKIYIWSGKTPVRNGGKDAKGVEIIPPKTELRNYCHIC